MASFLARYCYKQCMFASNMLHAKFTECLALDASHLVNWGHYRKRKFYSRYYDSHCKQRAVTIKCRFHYFKSTEKPIT